MPSEDSKTTVTVKNIAPSTSVQEIKDFFSFCGEIAKVNVTQDGDTKSAEVIFEKETAAKTALLLNNTQFGPNPIGVTSVGSHGDDAASQPTKSADPFPDKITQEVKPRTRILAEYLAHGYVVGDAAIQRAIELDQKHGVSSRFKETLQNLDTKYHATDRAKATDQSYSITQRADNLWLGLYSFFEKAADTPTGKKIAQFYTDGQKQVQEVHAEARRLADLKKEASGTATFESGTGDRDTSTRAAPAGGPSQVRTPVGGEQQ